MDLDYKKFVILNKKLIRPSSTVTLKANNKKAKKILKFNVKTDINKLIKIMMDNDLKIENNTINDQ